MRLAWARGSATSRPKSLTGFTLIEVLVALAITSIALLAGLQAAMALTDNAARQANLLLAHSCAENELVKVRLSSAMPPIGSSTQPCEQAGRTFTLTISVQPTANPGFRRIDVRVLDDAGTSTGLWALVGQY